MCCFVIKNGCAIYAQRQVNKTCRCIFSIIYLLAAWICQNALIQAGGDSFQKVHSIMLSRVFWDNEILHFRVWETARLTILEAAAICIILKAKLPDIRTLKCFLKHIFQSKNANIINQKMNYFKTASARGTIIAAQINDNKTMLGIVWCCMCLGIYGDCNGGRLCYSR